MPCSTLYRFTALFCFDNRCSIRYILLFHLTLISCSKKCVNSPHCFWQSFNFLVACSLRRKWSTIFLPFLITFSIRSSVNIRHHLLLVGATQPKDSYCPRKAQIMFDALSHIIRNNLLLIFHHFCQLFSYVLVCMVIFEYSCS